MSEYTATTADYTRSVVLSVLYTCFLQIFKIFIYYMSNKFDDYKKVFSYIYWIFGTVLLRVIALAILAYPQINEAQAVDRWNITVGEIVILGIGISLSEWGLNCILVRCRKSILYNYYTGEEFQSYRNDLAISQQRRHSSLAVMYKIKNDLIERQIHQKYYVVEGERDLDADPSSEGSSPKVDPNTEISTEARVVGDAGVRAGAGVRGSVHFENGVGAKVGIGGGVGGGFDQVGAGIGGGGGITVEVPGAHVSAGGGGGGGIEWKQSSHTDFDKMDIDPKQIRPLLSAENSLSEWTRVLEQSLPSLTSRHDTQRHNEQNLALLGVIGIFNIPEFVINLEIPLLTKNDKVIANDFYELLIHTNFLRFAFTLPWKVDSLIYNVTETMVIGLIYLMNKSSWQMSSILIFISIAAVRCLKYEIWRYVLLVSKISWERQKFKDLDFCNYGAITYELDLQKQAEEEEGEAEAETETEQEELVELEQEHQLEEIESKKNRSYLFKCEVLSLAMLVFDTTSIVVCIWAILTRL